MKYPFVWDQSVHPEGQKDLFVRRGLSDFINTPKSTYKVLFIVELENMNMDSRGCLTVFGFLVLCCLISTGEFLCALIIIVGLFF